MRIEEKLAELKKRDHLAEDGGGEQRRERQHKEGKMSARERIEFLLDEGTFEETDKLVTHRCNDFGMAEQKVYGDGFITGEWIVRLRHGHRVVVVGCGLGRFSADMLANELRAFLDGRSIGMAS